MCDCFIIGKNWKIVIYRRIIKMEPRGLLLNMLDKFPSNGVGVEIRSDVIENIDGQVGVLGGFLN